MNRRSLIGRLLGGLLALVLPAKAVASPRLFRIPGEIDIRTVEPKFVRARRVVGRNYPDYKSYVTRTIAVHDVNGDLCWVIYRVEWRGDRDWMKWKLLWEGCVEIGAPPERYRESHRLMMAKYDELTAKKD